MDIKKIVEMQVKLDESNGFPVKFPNTTEKYEQLTKDLVGLYGEIGEFSNIVKKINIKIDKGNKYDFDIETAEYLLVEELIDTLIYVIRLAAILNIDIENEIIKKIKFNANRYE